MSRVSWQDYKKWLGDTAVGFKEPKVDCPAPGKINRDSRKIEKGDLFIAIKGEKFDGHGFINFALEQGATCFLYESDAKVNPKNLPNGIKVTNTVEALQKIAAGYLATLDVKKVAITGSVGKTTCKQLTASILGEDGKTYASPASFNNEIGVPLTMLAATQEHKYLVLECGARHVGDIRLLVEMIQPDVAVTLIASDVHIAEFGSKENILNTKAEMFRHAPKTAQLIAPADQNALLVIAKETGAKVLSFGLADTSEVRVVKSEWREGGDLRTSYSIKGKTVEVTYRQGNEALVINGAAAAAIATALGVDEKKIASGLSKFEAGDGRFKIHKLTDYVVIDDAYNASPSSMLNGFKSCQKLYPKEQKVVVLADMLELGEESKSAHLQVGKECFEILQPDLLITVGEESKEIANGAIESGHPKDKVFSFEKVEQAAGLPARVFNKRDLIYLKGSNSMRLSVLVEHLLNAEG